MGIGPFNTRTTTGVLLLGLVSGLAFAYFRR